MMTDHEIWRKFREQESDGMARPEGPDYPAIYDGLAKEAGVSLLRVHEIIVEYTTNLGAG